MEVKESFIRDHVKKKHIELISVGTEDMWADGMTKALQAKMHEK